MGALSVALGAFGAHALKSSLAADKLATFHTATHYQMLHSLALLIVGVWLLHRVSTRTAHTANTEGGVHSAVACNRGRGTAALQLAGYSFLSGILCFSGSLYGLTFLESSLAGFLWPLTPLGGVLFLVGWLSLAVQAWQT